MAQLCILPLSAFRVIACRRSTALGTSDIVVCVKISSLHDPSGLLVRTGAAISARLLYELVSNKLPKPGAESVGQVMAMLLVRNLGKLGWPGLRHINRHHHI
jgi:hypothetical protein